MVGDLVGIRNSQRPDIWLAFGVEAWRDFIGDVKDDIFDAR
jgi:hypothetical protein